MGMVDFKGLTLETIQSQYGASPHIKGIIFSFMEKIDPNVDIDLFYEKIFDLDTAEGIGLDIWGRIVGVDRKMQATSSDYFGFAGSTLHPFNQAPFYDGDTAGGYYDLTDDAFRRLIYYKALANISDDTAEAQNRLLSQLLNHTVQTLGFQSVVPIGTMKIRTIFNYYLSDYELQIFKVYGLLNRGAGVGWEWYQIDPENTFGFNGSNLQPFNQGTFDGYRVIEGE